MPQEADDPSGADGSQVEGEDPDERTPRVATACGEQPAVAPEMPPPDGVPLPGGEQVPCSFGELRPLVSDLVQVGHRLQLERASASGSGLVPHAAADGLNHALQIALAEPLVHRKRDEAATPCSGVRVAPCHERMGTGPKRRCLHPGPADPLRGTRVALDLEREGQRAGALGQRGEGQRDALAEVLEQPPVMRAAPLGDLR